jgi:nucleosome binding factor SPN SPT16 subunit
MLNTGEKVNIHVTSCPMMILFLIDISGMTFNINIGFADLKDGDKKYALFIGDTVMANEVCVIE